MIKFNKNKLQTFKCKINVTGAGDNPKITPRLILSPKKSVGKLFFEGEYNDGTVIIEMQTGLDFAKSGDLILEIITNNTVFQPWSDTYEIVSEQVVVEGIELIDNDAQIIVEVTDTPKKASKTKINEFKDDLFKPNIDPKVKKRIIEYIEKTKQIPNKKARKQLLKYIIHSYKPNKTILEWGDKVFLNNTSAKAKIAMYCAELEDKKIKENRDSNIKIHFPEIEEWENNNKGNIMNWYVVSKKKWNKDRAKEFQTAVGYNPEEYWFDKFTDNKNIDGSFTYKWQSYSNSN